MSNILISLLIPSRGRSQLLYDNWKTLLSLSKNPNNIELLLYIDIDDSATIKMYNVMKKEFPNVNAIIGERLVPYSAAFNKLYLIANGSILFFTGDDYIVKTEHWDSIVLKEFDRYADKILLVYGDDGHQGTKCATTGFVHKNWVNSIGYLFPHDDMSRVADSWLTYVSGTIDRKVYLENLKIIHSRGEQPVNVVRSEAWKEDREIRKRVSRMFRKRSSIKQRMLDDIAKLNDFIKKCKDKNV